MGLFDSQGVQHPLVITDLIRMGGNGKPRDHKKRCGSPETEPNLVTHDW